MYSLSTKILTCRTNSLYPLRKGFRKDFSSFYNRKKPFWRQYTFGTFPRLRIEDILQSEDAPLNFINQVHYHHVVIIGGGIAGATLANHFAKLLRKTQTPLRVAVIDYSRGHFYSPGWLFSSIRKLDRMQTVQYMTKVIPPEITLIPDRVLAVDPSSNLILTKLGKQIRYDYLVIASGHQFDWQPLQSILRFSKKNTAVLASCFSFDLCDKLWQIFSKKMNPRGEVIFYEDFEPTPCPAAAKSILFLAQQMYYDSFRLWEVRLVTPYTEERVFSVPQYNDLIRELILDKQIILECGSKLLEVKENSLVFQNRNGNIVERDCILFHYTPRSQPISFLQNTPLLDESGLVKVNPYTLQNPEFPNVFACGDCAALPTMKSLFSAVQQIPIVLHNLLTTMSGAKIPFLEYDGYSLSPLYTAYGKAIWIQTDYSQQVLPPGNDPPKFKPRKLWWRLGRYLMPPFYWYTILPGHFKGFPPWIHSPSKIPSTNQKEEVANDNTKT